MSQLVVIGYDNLDQAEAARIELLGMTKEYLVDVADAAFATSDSEGGIKFNQMVNLWSLGAGSSAFWDLLVGLVLFNPTLKGTAGDGPAALTAALRDHGIDDNFMRSVASILRPGQAALFMMVGQNVSNKMIGRLSTKCGSVVRANLDMSKGAALQMAFNSGQSLQ